MIHVQILVDSLEYLILIIVIVYYMKHLITLYSSYKGFRIVQQNL